jgi:hypothetical protein
MAITSLYKTMSEEIEDKPEDEETSRLMEEHDIDEDTAENAQELIDAGLDEAEAVEIAEEI